MFAQIKVNVVFYAVKDIFGQMKVKVVGFYAELQTLKVTLSVLSATRPASRNQSVQKRQVKIINCFLKNWILWVDFLSAGKVVSLDANMPFWLHTKYLAIYYFFASIVQEQIRLQKNKLIPTKMSVAFLRRDINLQ